MGSSHKINVGIGKYQEHHQDKFPNAVVATPGFYEFLDQAGLLNKPQSVSDLKNRDSLVNDAGAEISVYRLAEVPGAKATELEGKIGSIELPLVLSIVRNIRRIKEKDTLVLDLDYL